MEDEELETTKYINYDDLDENLKERVRENYRNSGDIVPEDWSEFIFEDFSENHKEFTIDENSIEYDIYRNQFKITGDIDPQHEIFKSCIPDELQIYLDDERVYDISDSFIYGDGIRNEYYIDDDLIQSEIFNKIFQSDIDIEVDNNMIELEITTFKDGLINSLTLLEKYEVDLSVIKTWISTMEASELFFQHSINISESDYDNLLDSLYTYEHSKIQSLIEDEYYPAVDQIISKTFGDLWEILKSSYEYFYTDESIDGVLQDKTFEVEIDGNGNQIDILDLDGE